MEKNYYQAASYLEEIKPQVSFNAFTLQNRQIFMGLMNMISVSSIPYCINCNKTVSVKHCELGKVCKECGQLELVRSMGPRGFGDEAWVMLQFMMFDCDLPEASVSADELMRGLKNGSLVQLFGTVYESDELYEYLVDNDYINPVLVEREMQLL
ncbi:MAG: hypothetical protein EOP04_02865 [Proteobacteria bacterium]|nr:MAG: hypothetical protein EOP04_02865 [Pseudomonadota bacterium]